MIRTDEKKGEGIKAIRRREAELKEKQLREKCETIAVERFTKEKLGNWSNEHKGLWFLPILDDDGEIEKLAILKPIDRHILNYASTKIADEGIYEFLGAAMNECFIDGDRDILDDDVYFIPAAQKFQKIAEGKQAAMLKR